MWEIGINILQAFLFLSFLDYELKERKVGRLGALLAIIALAGVVSIVNMLRIPETWAMLIMITLFILCAIALFKNAVSLRVIWACVACMVFSCASIPTSLLVVSYVQMPRALLTPSMARMLPTSIYMGFSALLLWLLMKLPYRNNELPSGAAIWVTVYVYVLTALVSQLESMALQTEGTDELRMLLLIACLTCFGTVAVLFYIIRTLGRHYTGEKEAKYQLQRAEYQLQRAEDDIADAALAKTNYRKWRHDERHLMAAIREYAIRSGHDEFALYMNELSDSFDSATRMPVRTGIAEFDGVVSSFERICKEKEILFTATIEQGLVFPIPIIDIPVLFGNVLENAVDAAALCDKSNRYVCLSVEHVKKMIYIKCENGSTGTYNFDEHERLMTTKGPAHGSGLSRVAIIVERVGGFMKLVADPNKFVIEVWIPLAQQGEINDYCDTGG